MVLKKIFSLVILLMLLVLPVLATEIPQWKDYCPRKYRKVQEIKPLNTLNKDKIYRLCNSGRGWKLAARLLLIIDCSIYTGTRDYVRMKHNMYADYWGTRKENFDKELLKCALLPTQEQGLCYLKLHQEEEYKTKNTVPKRVLTYVPSK